jgi:hypothetical protein
MRTKKGWYERKSYIRSLNKKVAPRHHYAAQKSKRLNRPAGDLVDFQSLKQYSPQKKSFVNWSEETDLPIFDSSLHNKESPNRNYDFEKTSITPDEYIKIQEKILSKRTTSKTGHELFWNTADRKHIDRIKKSILEGKEMPRFVIEYDKDGALTGFQEGRHRIIAMKELGVEKVPVFLMKKRY